MAAPNGPHGNGAAAEAIHTTCLDEPAPLIRGSPYQEPANRMKQMRATTERCLFFMLLLTCLLPLRISADGGRGSPAAGAVQSIAFIREGNVWIADIQGTAVSQLTFSGADASPALSPDGKWVAYHSGSDERTGFGHLYRVPSTGGVPQRIPLSGMEGGEDPSFSPDGRRIVFVGMSEVSRKRTRGFDGVQATMSIALLDLDTGVVQRIISRKNVLLDAGYLFGHPSLSPDGRLIAYQHSGSDVSGGFSVMDRSGKRVFRFPQSRSDSTPYWGPRFSADGQRILCYSPATSEDQIDTIFLIDMKTGLKRRITEGSRPLFVDNGRSIIFERWRNTWHTKSPATSTLWHLDLRAGAQPKRIL